jgi:hypothetical protein
MHAHIRPADQAAGREHEHRQAEAEQAVGLGPRRIADQVAQCAGIRVRHLPRYHDGAAGTLGDPRYALLHGRIKRGGPIGERRGHGLGREHIGEREQLGAR